MEKDSFRIVDAKPKSVWEVLAQKKYTLDYYQREYLWQTKHMQKFIVDLTDKFSESYKSTDPRSKVNEYGGYFLGPIIINSKDGQMSIVDGQQRLTSLTLLLIYLHHLQMNSSKPVPIDQLVFSEKFDEKSFNLNIEDRKDCMKNLLETGEYRFTGSSDSVDESVKNILLRYGEIQAIFPKDDINANALPYFIEWLIYKVSFVEISTYSEDDAYTIFETMNDRGLQLSPADMLKGYVISKSPKEERIKLNEIWRKDRLKLVDVGYEEEFNEFLKAFLRAKYAVSIRQGKERAENEDFEKIGTRFHEWFRENEKKLIGMNNAQDFANFIKADIPFYTGIYETIIDHQENFNTEFESIYNINKLGLAYSIFYPFLISSITLGDDGKTVDKKLRLSSLYLEFFVVFRGVNNMRYQQSSIRYTMYSLTKEIRNKSVDELAEIFEDRVSEIVYDLSGVKTLTLNSQNKNFIHFLLAKITSHIERASGSNYSFKEYFEGYDIEHIMPANYYERNRNEFSDGAEFEDYRNRLGGLLILPYSFNRSYGAMPYEQKVDHYYGQNLLAKSLNSKCYENNPGFRDYITKAGLPFKEYPRFGKESTEQRQDLYERILEEIYNIEVFSEIASKR
jgi:uncharacterized protein with ParB-like and HNH nuclease domain